MRYFVAPDANDEPTLWRENGDYPKYVIGIEFFRDDPDVWAVLVAATEGATREAAAAEQARAEVVRRVEAGIAQVEELAASATNYGGDLVGYYIKADDWRRVRATFRSALATEQTP